MFRKSLRSKLNILSAKVIKFIVILFVVLLYVPVELGDKFLNKTNQ